MASLTLAGFEVRVLEGTWSEKPSFYTGGRVRTRGGTLRSTEGGGLAFPFLGRKRICECQVDLYDLTEEGEIRVRCLRGVGIEIAGDLPDASFTGVVDIGDVTKTTVENNDEIVDVLRAMTLHIEEV